MRVASPVNVNLDGMTKAQLLDYATQNDIDGVNSSMTKANILSVLKEARASA